MSTAYDGVVRTQLEAALGVGLAPELLQQALTHRSYAYEHGGVPTNERLEFLGDSVLGIVVTDRIYRREPPLSEGDLAKLRASVVSTRALAEVATGLGLGRWLLLGNGEEMTGGRAKSSILADTLEALIGATYLEHGIEGAQRLVERLFVPVIEAAVAHGAGRDWKTGLQERAAALGLGAPEYVLVGSGPDHAKVFTGQVLLLGEVRGTGRGSTKKEAEQVAAEQAMQALGAGDA